ncbi:MAG: antitermination protein NusG [Planctomycetes bacterium]|nr:antitermination protein NusG [Planctomycetota bacterium]
MLKYADNPPIVSTQATDLLDWTGTWWVAHTKARAEKAFAWDLLRQGIDYFLPMVDCVRVSGGRKRRLLVPLFPSYVFFCGGEEDRYHALATNRLCQTLEAPDRERLVGELVQLQRALASRAQLDPYPFAAVGARCRVKAGPLRGLDGIVIRRDKTARLVLQVSMLGQGAAVEVDASLLEPA